MNKELSYEGSKIFYRVIGNGDPVVLLHGFGEDSEIWKNQVRPPQTPPKEGLSYTQSQPVAVSLPTDKFMYIVPDLPGSGKSEMIDDMSMEGMAEVIKAIIDSEVKKEKIKISESSEAPSFGGGLGEVCIIGHSMGGYITLAFAEKYPGFLRDFGLFHSSAFADNEEKKATRRKGIEFIQKHGSKAFLETVIPNLFAPIPIAIGTKSLIPPKESLRTNSIKELIDKSDNFSPTSLVSYYEAMMERPDRTDVLKKAGVPVLFIMGEHDKAVPMEDVLKQSHMPETAFIHILHQSGHMGMLELVPESNNIIKNFLLQGLLQLGH